MKHILKLSLLAGLFLMFAACENTELDELLDNPNAVTPANAELDLLYNNMMLDFVAFVDEASDETQPYIRQVAMTGGNQYLNQDAPVSFDFIWNLAYADLFPDMDLIIQLAEDAGFAYHAGTARIMKAYVLFTLVDLFGDIPFSEATQGVTTPNPLADDDAAVYAAAYDLLDQGITNLSGTIAGKPSNDLIYNGNTANWIKAGNSMKIRYHVMTRLVNSGGASEINSIVSSGNYIQSPSEDMQFQYGTNRVNPNSRHPYYSGAYEQGSGTYMSNYFMWTLFGEKSFEDPRLRYYIYRQDCDETDEDQFTLDCPIIPYPFHWPEGLPWCTASLDFGDPAGEYGGYWGRDHGNNDGIPPDDLKRSTWGPYPAGGKFDADDCTHVGNLGTDGGGGAGIQPIMMSSFVDFFLAEAALTMGVSGDARAYLENGVRESIDKVMSFSASVTDVNPDYVPTADDINAYVNEVLNNFDAAATTDDKVGVVVKEFWLAAFGNGLEPFNSYRRTGYPKGMQPTRDPDSGDFARLFWYPSDFVNLNANATQRTITQQVFWDTNPAGFIN